MVKDYSSTKNGPLFTLLNCYSEDRLQLKKYSNGEMDNNDINPADI